MSDGGGPKRRGFEEEHEEHENHERWLVSYADMMTLLMVLFIVMFAISQVDSKKFMALKTGLASGFGAPVAMLSGADALLDVGGHVAPDSVNLAGVAGNKNADPDSAAAKQGTDQMDVAKAAELVNATAKAQVKAEVDNLKKAQAQLQKALAAAGQSKGATFRFNEQGLVVSVATDKVLYASGGAKLLPGGRKILDALAPTLGRLPNRLSIDGHTDPHPISTAMYPSNWELSTARATGVLRYLASVHKIPYTRMFATGYADTRPLVAGTGARADSANRRVEIIVVARVDDSAGRNIAALGNTPTASGSGTPTTGATPSAGATPSPSPTTRTPSGQASRTGSASASAGAGSTTTPTPVHNLLGPDPTPTARATGTRTAGTRAGGSG